MGDVFIRVGDKVMKKSRKPFKSGEKVATIKSVTVNPYTNRTAFSFVEDNSIVDAHQCKKVQSQRMLMYINSKEKLNEYRE